MLSISSLSRSSLRFRSLHSYRGYATAVSTQQTLIEKIVQSYAVDLPEGKKVKSGDYVMIRPEHV